MTPRRKLESIVKHGRTGLAARALWRHFPHEDFHSGAFVAAQCDFVQRHRMDLAKITPRSSYCLRDYGVADVFAGDYLGRPKYINKVVQKPSGWAALPVLDPRAGCLGQMLEITRAIAGNLGSEYPIVLTVFSPLTQAGNLAGPDAVAAHWQQEPASVRRGLETLAQSTLAFLSELKSVGVDGIYFAVQESHWPGAVENGLIEAGHPFNRAILEASPGWLNMLHVHGAGQAFADYARYPAQILHWDHRASGIDAREGARLFPGIVSGSVAWPLSREQDGEKSVCEQARHTLRTGLGGRELLSSECVIPFETPPAWIDAFIETADGESAGLSGGETN